MIIDSRKKYGKVCPLCLSRSPFYNLFVSLSYKCLVQERHTSIFLFFPVSDLINIWWLIFGKNTSVKINIYKQNEAEFQALHKFLSYGVSLSGIWKYEREIQKVEKYPLWKEYLRPFQFPCESRCYDPTPRREDSPHGGVQKSSNCGEE